MDSAQRPLEVILARNLITNLATPSFLVGDDGELLFYNEAAGAFLGLPFEDLGRTPANEWLAKFGPFEESGKPMELEASQLTKALRGGRAAHASFHVRSAAGKPHAIEASAVPIIGPDRESSGAMIFFWLDETKEHPVVSDGG
jgi:PAS domain-containing protein